MKRLTFIALAMLPGCAGFDEWQHQREMNQTVVTEVAPGQFRTLTYRELAELNAERAREAEQWRRATVESQEADKRRQAQLEKQATARREAARARVAGDQARGYKHVSLADFILDHKTIPHGSKRAVRGYYQVFGELETLASMPVDSPANNVARVVLLTASSPRDVRAKLLAYPCRPAFCEVVLLGRTTPCTIKWLGNTVRDEVCLAIDETW